MTVIIDNLPGYGALDISADNIVIWTAGIAGARSETLQSNEVPLEIYMEGNVVFRQGDRTIYAQRMYYDVRGQVGTVLDVEILSPVPNFGGNAKFRLRGRSAADGAGPLPGPGRLCHEQPIGTARLSFAGEKCALRG